MTTRSPFLPALVTAASLACVVAAVAQTPPARSLYDRYTEPIPIYKTGLGTFTRPMSSKNKEAQAFFDQGFQMMYSFAKPEAVRSFREAWKKRSRVRDLLLGRGVGVGVVPQRADERRGVAARVCRRAEGAVAEGPRHAEGAGAHRGDGGPLRREVRRRPSGSSRIAPMRDAMEKVVGAVSRRSRDRARFTPTRCSCSSRGAARATSTIPNVQQLHQVLESVLSRDVHHPGACHLYVHATESTTVPGRAEACAEFLGRSIPGASHINHMPSHTWNEVGRWGDSVRANLDGVAFGPEGRDRRGLRDLSRAQPAHAAVCGVVRRPGRDRDARREGLREADRRHVLRGADADPVRPLR